MWRAELGIGDNAVDLLDLEWLMNLILILVFTAFFFFFIRHDTCIVVCWQDIVSVSKWEGLERLVIV